MWTLLSLASSFSSGYEAAGDTGGINQQNYAPGKKTGELITAHICCLSCFAEKNVSLAVDIATMFLQCFIAVRTVGEIPREE